MASSQRYLRPTLAASKRVKLSSPLTSTRSIQTATNSPASEYLEFLRAQVAPQHPEFTTGATTTSDEAAPALSRLPRNIQTLYLRPLKRTPTHGIPVADLQLRSYSVQPLEHFADFALRAAYYLHLPAKLVFLPRMTSRWTVPKSNFIYKKTQENFERVTLRRLVQVQDGHPAVVRVWLSFLKKHAMAGVGMKANLFDFESLDFVERTGREKSEVQVTVEEEVERLVKEFEAAAVGGSVSAKDASKEKESTQEKAERMMEGEEGVVDPSEEGEKSSVEEAEDGMLSEAEQREKDIDEKIEKEEEERKRQEMEKKKQASEKS